MASLATSEERVRGLACLQAWHHPRGDGTVLQTSTLLKDDSKELCSTCNTTPLRSFSLQGEQPQKLGDSSECVLTRGGQNSGTTSCKERRGYACFPCLRRYDEEVEDAHHRRAWPVATTLRSHMQSLISAAHSSQEDFPDDMCSVAIDFDLTHRKDKFTAFRDLKNIGSLDQV
jgi:hypothetical protein